MTTHVYDEYDDYDYDAYVDYSDDYIDYDDDNDYFSQQGVSDQFSLFYFMIPANNS